MRVLIVDDSKGARRILRDICASVPGVELVEAESAAQARAHLAEQRFDLAFLDLRLSPDARDRQGLDVLEHVKESSGAIAVMLTAHGDLNEVRAAMRLGAWDYILKEDLCDDVIRPVLEHVRGAASLALEVRDLRARQAQGQSSSPLIGGSLAMRRLEETLAKIALSSRPALIIGPTGSGKELIARRIHALGPHPEAPLVDLNCATLPEQLIETQLFGHEKGAFTSADKKHAGLLEAAGAGTVFLDEIAEMPLGTQAKLLRVLEDATFRPVGATEKRPLLARVVAATHADLRDRVAKGAFREDLFNRLDVLRVRVPSLDERRDDIPLLVAHFAARQDRPLQFTEAAMRAVQAAPFPGNVRALKNLIDRIGVLGSNASVDESDVLEHLELDGPARSEDPWRAAANLVLAAATKSGVDKLATIENALVMRALEMADGNKTEAAKILGVHRKVIERRTQSSAD